MLVRIVKLTFRTEDIASFRSLFEKHKETIKTVEGCTFLELLQDLNDQRIFFTHSHWNSSTDLENYRNSDYFKNVWKTSKLFFADKPEAWSLQKDKTNNQKA